MPQAQDDINGADAMKQAPTPGPLSVGDYAVRLEDHPLVKAGEVHRVTEMFRGGYLGFARPVGGEWNPSGWRKCDADGWVPWSGGPNPVPGQRVEAESEACAYHGLSDEFDWIRGGHYKIHRFRLAPTAPVEASGSELLPCPFCGGEAEIVHLDDGDNVGGSCVCCTKCQASGNVEFGRKENFVENWNRRAALRPQPSGETRSEGDVRLLMKSRSAIEAGLATLTGLGAKQGGRISLMREASAEITAALIRPAPVASGGQHSSATDFPPDDVLACVGDWK